MKINHWRNGVVVNMNLLRKNQVIIYTAALMLVAAGYLNYTGNIGKQEIMTSSQEIVQDNIVNESLEESNIASENNETSENTESSKENNSDVSISNSNETDANNVESTSTEISENETNTKEEHTKKDENENNQTIASIGDATLVSSSDVVTDYFAKSKLERDSMYSQMIETYEKILNSGNSLETQKQSATQEITKINDTKNSIMICENLIRTKGFENSVVFVNGDSVSVIIGAQSLKKEEIAQIQNIISRELNAKIENIHISTR